MNKTELLNQILNAQTNDEKLDILKTNCKGLKLYRYRPYKGEKQEYELESVKTNQIWASRPDQFDDDYEGTIIASNKNDLNSIFTCIEKINKDDAKKELLYGHAGSVIRTNQGSDKLNRLIDFLYTYDKQNRECKRNAKKRIDYKCMDTLLRRYRNTYAVSCLSENEPLNNINMWKQYALNKDGTISGFCLEYDLEEIINQGYVICPIYYHDNSTISELCNCFNYHIESVFLHKNTQGYDKNKDPMANNLISWEAQNEWRIVISNPKKEKGLYLSHPISPKKLYYLEGTPNIADILDVFPGEKQTVGSFL